MGHGRCHHWKPYLSPMPPNMQITLPWYWVVWIWFGGQSTFGCTFPLLDLTRTLRFPHITCLGLSLSKLRMQCKAMVNVMTVNLAMSTRLDGVGIFGGRLRRIRTIPLMMRPTTSLTSLFSSPLNGVKRGFGVSLWKPIVSTFTSIMFSLVCSKTWNT